MRTFVFSLLLAMAAGMAFGSSKVTIRVDGAWLRRERLSYVSGNWKKELDEAKRQSDAQKNSTGAILMAPRVMRLDLIKTIPVVLTVTSPKLLSAIADAGGAVKIWASGAQIIGSDGTKSYDPYTTKLSNGSCKATVSLEGRYEDRSPMKLFATYPTIGADALVAKAVVVVRYDEYITISADPSVAADGKAGPVVTVTIADQNRWPMSNAKVTVKGRIPTGKISVDGITDANGVAKVRLPPSTKPGPAIVQAVTQHLASQQVFITYDSVTRSKSP